MSLRSEIIRVLNEILGNSKKVSELDSLPTNVDNSDLIEVVRAGQNYKATGSQLPSGGGGTVESVTGTGVDNTDPDNPVIELANGLESVDTTGTSIAFAVPQFYGTPGAPESGNITLDTTGLVKGMVQVLYHDNGTEPTYPASFVKLSGTYSTTVLNIIYMQAISTTRIEYTISQEA